MWKRIREFNVMRILSGLKPEPSWWCRFKLHDWTKWETTYTARFSDTKRRYEEIRRQCNHCGVPELKIITDQRDRKKR